MIENGGVGMSQDKESPERRRERLRQEELKRSATGNLNDSFNRAENGNLADLVGSLGWKGTGILIIVIIISFVVASIFLK